MQNIGQELRQHLNLRQKLSKCTTHPPETCSKFVCNWEILVIMTTGAVTDLAWSRSLVSTTTGHEPVRPISRPLYLGFTYRWCVTLASGLLRQSIAAVIEDGGDQNKAPHGTGYWTQNLVQAEITTITSLLMTDMYRIHPKIYDRHKRYQDKNKYQALYGQRKLI